jgi:hypothetical protein
MRKFLAVGLVSATVFLAGFWVHAQVQPPNVPRVPPPGPGQPNVLNVVSGNDVGFRIDNWEGDTPVGRWVIRRDGKWVEVRTSIGTRRLTSP